MRRLLRRHGVGRVHGTPTDALVTSRPDGRRVITAREMLFGVALPTPLALNVGWMESLFQQTKRGRVPA